MTVSKVYNFLDKPRQLAYQIYGLEKKKAALESCLYPSGIRYDTDPVQTTPDDSMAELVSQIDELERKIVKLKKERARTIKRIGEMIELLPYEREKAILTAYYLGGVSVSKIAENINYSVQRVYQLRRDAVFHLSKRL